MGLTAAAATPAQRQNFLNLCSQANTKVDLAQRRFSAWLSSLTAAYSQAWIKHTSFLKDMELEARLMNDLIINAALAFIPGGVGGIVGDSMKKLGSTTALIDGAKDLSKWSLRSGAMTGMPGGAISIKQPAFKAFPADPLSWSSQINGRVQTELANVTAAIELWQDLTNKASADLDISGNPALKVADTLKLSPPVGSDKPLSDLSPEDIPSLQRFFEAGFLATWIDKFAAEAFMGMSQAAWSGIIFDGVSQKIVKYGDSVGIGALGVGLDTAHRLSEAVNKGVAENNERARASGHGLI